MNQRRPNPLYSPLGCGSAILLVLFLAIMLYFTGPSLFSPGKLSAASGDGPPKIGFSSHAEFEQECQLCHKPWSGVAPTLCTDCHSTIIFERETRSGLHGRLTGTERCVNCHTDHHGYGAAITFYNISDFPHDSATGFTLVQHLEDYQGDLITCIGCHPSSPFREAAVDCTGCHASNDPEFFQDHRSLFGEDCLKCHDGHDSMSTFEHGQVFQLDGSHAALLCSACHNKNLDTAIIRECVDCHGEPELHHGLFGTDCARCHTTGAWTPAQLNQHMFPLDHGEQGKIECLMCHEDSYTRYSCYGCHEHNPQEIMEEHEKEDIQLVEECVSCHPAGAKIDD